MILSMNPASRLSLQVSFRMNETVLNTLAGSSENERLQVTLCHDTTRGSRVELRQQSWGEGVGWFTQSKVELLPHQIGDLRGTLGGSVRPLPTAPAPTASLPTVSRPNSGSFVPRIVRAESA